MNLGNTLKIYYIDDNYINYLRQFDSKVYYNKNHTRPYVGVVYIFNGYYYFAPLSSPKPKHLKMNPNAECLTEAIPNITDIKYKNLLQNQSTFLNNHKSELLIKVNQFQSRYLKKHLSKNILDRCCDYSLLEKKCQEYINNYIN